jgi:hypothetical protein
LEGGLLTIKTMPGIHPKDLAEYRNSWKVFDA